MESVNLENKSQAQKIDRVVLDQESIVVIQKISDQVQNELGDLVQISQKDIVTFLIQERSVELSSAEMSKIKNQNFDIVRALKRATQEAIKAKQDGLEIKMDELLKIIQTPGVIQNYASKKPRGRRKKNDVDPTTRDSYNANMLDISYVKNANNSNLKNQTSESKPQNSQPLSKPVSS